MGTILDSALEYHASGFSVVPVDPNKDQDGKISKKSLVKWREYQNHQPQELELRQWFSQWPNAMVGIVTGKQSNLFVVDCDDQAAVEYVYNRIPDSLSFPIVKTPRGGQHLWFRYPVGETLTVATGLGGMKLDYRGEGGYIVSPPSMNVDGKRYQWLEGCSLREVGPQALPNALLIDLKSFLKGGCGGGECKGQAASDTTTHYTHYKILQEGSRDNDLFKIGMALADGKCSPDVIVQVMEMLAKSANPPFPLDEIPNKMKSIFERMDRKERNLSEDVREYFLLQEGYTFTTDILQTLQLTTKEEKKNLTVILSRLQAQGVIEKYGEKRGCYRPIKKNDSLVPFIEREFQEYQIKLPLGLNDQCKLYGQNIILLAGSKSAGKTAFLMDIAFRNQDTKSVVYLNSEMGAEEWTSRCKNRGVTKAAEIKFKCIDCHEKFHYQMDGEDRIYLIDFLERHNDFFAIGKDIRAIHEKLGKGVCVIAVQKKFDGLLSRGAEFSMEKSRLYLALDWVPDHGGCSKLVIVDAKAPRSSMGIKFHFKRFKISGGGVLGEVFDKDWRYDPTLETLAGGKQRKR